MGMLRGGGRRSKRPREPSNQKRTGNEQAGHGAIHAQSIIVSEVKMALLSRALIRRSAISTVTRMAVMATSLALQDSASVRQDAPGAAPMQRSSDIERVAHEGPLPVSYASDRPARVYLDLAVRAYQRQQRHIHCQRQAQGSE